MKKWASVSAAAVSSLEPLSSGWSKSCFADQWMRQLHQDARGGGPRERRDEQRIYLISAWQEAPCYSDRECAALGWTKALTRLSEGHNHERAYEALKAPFSEEEQIKLTSMINVINGWNRISVGFGLFVDPATARSAAAKAAA